METEEFGKLPQTPRERADRTALRILCVALAVLFVLLAGAGGFFIWYYTRDPAERTLSWVKSMVRKHYYQEIPEELLDAAEMEDIFGGDGKEGLLDRYSAYYTAEELKAQLETQAGHQTGTGLSFLQSSDGLQIYRVAGNSPAEHCGLTAGLYLLGYGEDESADTVYTDFNTFSTFVGAQADEEIFYLRAGEEPADEGEVYAVCKAAYTQSYVFYDDAEESYRYTGDRTEGLGISDSELTFLPADAAYIRIDSFAGDAARQLRGLLEVFASKGKTGLILDLRNNGGGQLDVLAEIASMLCKNAEGSFPVVNIEYRSGAESYSAARSDYYEYFTAETEITVLANYNTASASEALIGAMLDYGSIGYEDIFLAEIDGTAHTYGKGIMQTTYTNLLTGEGIKLTTAAICWPVSGNCIQDRGILPADGAIALPCDGALDKGHKMLRAAAEDFFG